MRTVLIAGLAAVLALVDGASASSSPEPFIVSVDPSSTCPEVESFARRLVKRAPHLRPAHGAEPSIRFIVSASAAGAGYGGRLRIVEPGKPLTERVVSGDTCAGVVDALALVAAILVEGRSPEAGAPSPRRADPEPAAIVSSEPLARSALARPRARPRPSSAKSAWGIVFGTSVGFNTAAGPTLSFGPGADIGVTYRSRGLWSPEFRLGALTRATSDVSTEAGRATFRWWTMRGVTSPLRWPESGALSLRPMVGVEVGRQAAQGFTTDDPQRTTVPWWAVELGALGEAQWLGPLALTSEVALVLPGRRDSFYFDGPRGRVAAFRARGWGGAARLGLSVRLP